MPIPVKSLTDNFIKGLREKPARKGTRVYVRSKHHPYVLVCVYDKRAQDGKARMSYMYGSRRFPGAKQPTRREIGAYTDSIAAVHEKAREWDGLIARGIDPATVAEKKPVKVAPLGDNTFGALVPKFTRFCCQAGQRRWKEQERLLRKEFADWHGTPVTDIAVKGAVTAIRTIAARSPSTAHNALAAAACFFVWCEENDHIERGTSPVAGVRAKWVIGKKKPRQHTLDDRHIKAFWNAAEKIGFPYGPAYQLLLLTGTRRDEWFGAKWDEVQDGFLVVPPERFKSDTTHLVPLSSTAQAIIDELPTFRGGNVLFTFDGTHLMNSHSTHKKRLDALMRAELGSAFKPWRVHDLRRVVRTGMAKLRVDKALAKMCIGHGHGDQLERTYLQYEFTDEIREALESWAGRVRDLVTPPPENLAKRRIKGRAA